MAMKEENITPKTPVTAKFRSLKTMYTKDKSQGTFLPPSPPQELKKVFDWDTGIWVSAKKVRVLNPPPHLNTYPNVTPVFSQFVD